MCGNHKVVCLCMHAYNQKRKQVIIFVREIDDEMKIKTKHTKNGTNKSNTFKTNNQIINDVDSFSVHSVEDVGKTQPIHISVILVTSSVGSLIL